MENRNSDIALSPGCNHSLSHVVRLSSELFESSSGDYFNFPLFPVPLPTLRGAANKQDELKDVLADKA